MKYLLASLFAILLFSAFGQNGSTPVPAPVTGNYYVDTARPVEQIQATFPFDIPLRNAAGDTLNSATVFQKNGKPTVLMFWLTTCGPCRTISTPSAPISQRTTRSS
ncbi:MAG: hypothetical protein MUC59_03690 [Saprospiraceae bacterium]|nr:hypothetical protein [Saprospiraceae bacterium]